MLKSTIKSIISYFERQNCLSTVNGMQMTSANAKALGLIDHHDTELDGVILFGDYSNNSSLKWETDYSDRTSVDGLDLYTIAAHEIAHALGFTSSLDVVDGEGLATWLGVEQVTDENGNNLVTYEDYAILSQLEQDFANKFNPLDVFRVSSLDPQSVNSFSDEPEILRSVVPRSNEPNYFSFDGENIAGYWSEGKWFDYGDANINDSLTFGDGRKYQGSHWKDGSTNSIMLPSIGLNEFRDFSSLDLQALDVIGWDVADYNGNYLNTADTNAVSSNTATDIEFEAAIDLFEAGRRSGRSRRSGFRRQEFDTEDDFVNALFSEGYLQELSSVQLNVTSGDNSNTDARHVPEPGFVLGFLSLGLWGIGRKKKATS